MSVSIISDTSLGPTSLYFSSQPFLHLCSLSVFPSLSKLAFAPSTCMVEVSSYGFSPFSVPGFLFLLTLGMLIKDNIFVVATHHEAGDFIHPNKPQMMDLLCTSFLPQEDRLLQDWAHLQIINLPFRFLTKWEQGYIWKWKYNIRTITPKEVCAFYISCWQTQLRSRSSETSRYLVITFPQLGENLRSVWICRGKLKYTYTGSCVEGCGLPHFP